MDPGDGDMGDGDGRPQEEQSSREREAAVDAAQQLLAGPYVRVPRSTLLGLLAALRQSTRLIEDLLAEADAQPADATDDASAAE